MAEPKKDSKSFLCPAHLHEEVICLSKNPFDKKLLYCVHCILQADTATKNSILPIKSAYEEIFNKLYSQKRLTIDDSHLDPFLETLDTKTDAVTKLSDHIMKEKERVSQEFNLLINDITQLINEAKAKIFKQLDKQVDVLKENYLIYRQKLKKHSDFDNGNRKISSLEDFCRDIEEKCSSSDVFGQVWRDLLEEVKDNNDMYSVYGNKAHRVLLDKLEEYKKMVEGGHKVYPKSLMSSGFYSNALRNDLFELIKNFLTKNAKLDAQILNHEEFLKSVNLTCCLDSRILRSYDLPLLEKLTGKPIYNMSLEFRASKDCTDLDIAKKIFRENDDVLLLVKTTEGQMVGHRKMMSQDNKSAGGKFSPKAVTFSLTDQVLRTEEVQESVGLVGQFLNGVAGNNNNNNSWPSKYLNLSNPVVLLQEIGFMEILPTLDGKGFYSKTFAPREVEVFRFL